MTFEHHFSYWKAVIGHCYMAYVITMLITLSPVT